MYSSQPFTASETLASGMNALQKAKLLSIIQKQQREQQAFEMLNASSSPVHSRLTKIASVAKKEVKLMNNNSTKVFRPVQVLVYPPSKKQQTLSLRKSGNGSVMIKKFKSRDDSTSKNFECTSPAVRPHNGMYKDECFSDSNTFNREVDNWADLANVFDVNDQYLFAEIDAVCNSQVISDQQPITIHSQQPKEFITSNNFQFVKPIHQNPSPLRKIGRVVAPLQELDQLDNILLPVQQQQVQLRWTNQKNTISGLSTTTSEMMLQQLETEDSLVSMPIVSDTPQSINNQNEWISSIFSPEKSMNSQIQKEFVEEQLPK